MNKEYLQAKADLCLNQAEKDLQQEEIARAIANLKRANLAISRIFNLEEKVCTKVNIRGRVMNNLYTIHPRSLI
jgi:hypothetical protein